MPIALAFSFSMFSKSCTIQIKTRHVESATEQETWERRGANAGGANLQISGVELIYRIRVGRAYH
jgi:hypothetical protein